MQNSVHVRLFVRKGSIILSSFLTNPCPGSQRKSVLSREDKTCKDKEVTMYCLVQQTDDMVPS